MSAAHDIYQGLLGNARVQKTLASQVAYSGAMTYMGSEMNVKQLAFGAGMYFIHSGMGMLEAADIPFLSKQLGDSESLASGAIALVARAFEVSDNIANVPSTLIPESQADVQTMAMVFAIGMGADYLASMVIGQGSKAN